MEVDLQYPKSIHDDTNDFPLAVEKKSTSISHLSPYNKEYLQSENIKFVPTEKLVPDLNDKKNYVCSLKNLQLYMRKGLVLENIHRVLAADQTNFAKSYIDFNSCKRKEAKNDFQKDLFKLLNNAIYGKFIESLRKRTNVDVVKDQGKAKKLISKPQFVGFQILDDEITIVQSKKKSLTLNKPIACGFIVLENSKNIMLDFWYNTLKPKYGEKIKLLVSDTDSFIYGVETEDAYKDLYSIKDQMDLSGYQSRTALERFYDPTNKKVPAKFSDEKPLEILKEVIALKPKMYSILTKKLVCEVAAKRDAGKTSEKYTKHVCDNSCRVGGSTTAKGITKAAQKHLSHEEYRRILNEKKTNMISNRGFETKNHRIYTVLKRKKGLSAFDDKKYILEDGVNTLSYGHYRIENLSN